MDTEKLRKWTKKIKVTNLINADVEVVNNSPLKLIGKGRQGAVFRYSDDICVKVFGNQEDCDREHYALSLGQHTNLFPKIHAKGKLYIAMDFVRGVDLREYLQSQPLTEELSDKLIKMLIVFKEIGYERIDHHKRQIYLQEDGSLKVIDVARTVWRDRVYPYPRKLLNSLGDDNKEIFLSHVQALSPQLYEEWLHYIRMEELSREIYQLILNETPDEEKKKEKKKSLKTESDKLLTRDDEKNYVLLMEGLMHKVFKEEWVKTMLARGEDPDKVMEEIDNYWDERELESMGIKVASSKSDQNKNTRRYTGFRESRSQSSTKSYKQSKSKSKDKDLKKEIKVKYNDENGRKKYTGSKKK
ncbi:hypothetical protein [Neobacillus kokaensis]|uniref:Protein kinase domain-containing protein n=1 Tax=Neobacillus kokaensis TaxID=2759023 RepID=A0ABQ3MWS2_9BACI|nr:hypothetical protein [Neobacillus kokaensis]GHH96872.1 hypothetical protein AM1BK_04150 [Neobacillus kokaensis]